jgi:hypothetical protein
MTNDEAKKRLAELSAAIVAMDEALEPLRDESHALRRGIADAIEKRMRASSRGESDAKFAADELTFAAHARCDCGAGLAYPNDIGVHGWWDCSAILTGTADRAVKHAGELPFVFYEIKSDNQPSANGATTRPS